MTKKDRINKWFGSEQQMSDQIMEEMIQALDARDSEALKEMFSKEALIEAKDLDQQIAEMMKFYKGKMVSYKGIASSQTNSENGEDVEKDFQGHYTLVTDKETYQVLYEHKPIDRESPDKIGLSSLELITQAFFDKNKEEIGPYEWQADLNGPGVYTKE